jgi:hypothetical protein
LSKGVTISKLEALLSRIRTRAAEPRAARPALAPAHVPASAPAAVAPAPVAAPARAVAPPAAVAQPAAPAFVEGVGVVGTPQVRGGPAPPAAPALVPPAAFVPPQVTAEPVAESIPPEMLEETTLPPPPLADAPGDADFDVDVDVPAPTPEPAAVMAPSAAHELADSRERLSAAPEVSPEPAAIDAGPSNEPVEVVSDEEAMAGADDDDEGAEAPASSRRPVAPPPEERLAELAFGAEEPQPARHTPPPKSGRLPAPPAVEFDADVTGVRAHPGLEGDDEAISARGGEPSVLSPEAVRADLASGANVRVPDVIGEAQAFAPATFLALLDASLSL